MFFCALMQFQTFHERLAGVNIDVARKLGKFSATPEVFKILITHIFELDIVS